MAKEHIYKVRGMHCASCEILTEKKLLELPNIKSVDASTSKGEIVIEYEGDRPNLERLNKIFKEENYQFSDLNSVAKIKPESRKNTANPTLVAFNIAIFIVIGFLILDKIGIANFLSLSSASSLIAFFGFGLLAGISSCAALVGGIVLSMSKQWNSLYAENQPTGKKLQPHMMFNAGRVISYAVLGGILGLIGNRLQISLQFTAFLIVAISLLMIALGLQMLGIKAFRKFQLSPPKSVTRYIANENNFLGKDLTPNKINKRNEEILSENLEAQGGLSRIDKPTSNYKFKAKISNCSVNSYSVSGLIMPFIMGALTFFLPCGFTVTAQGLALLSGNAWQGALIMGAFALGTVPMLLFIGLSSVKFSAKPHLTERFTKVAGFLVLFFALFNISNQMTVLGFTGINLSQNTPQVVDNNQNGLPPIVNGQQVIKMTASGSGDSPNYFKVKAGIPVRWEITASNSLGCNGAIISNNLFNGSVSLTPGQTVIKEFTPQSIGVYGFSCTMGMIRGTIEVIK